MKNISFIVLALSLFVFSCTQEEISPVGGDKYSDFASDALGEGSGPGGSGGDGGQGGNTQIEPGQITAGEWNDLLNWSFWTNLGQEEDYAGMESYWEYNLSDRISLKLTNSLAVPLIDIRVELLDKDDNMLWVSKTDNFGTAELWPFLLNNSSLDLSDLKIRIEDQIFTDLKNYDSGINEFSLELPAYQSPEKKMDIAFMVDATGSMSDELEYLKVELIDVIETVKSDNPDAVLNLGSVFYRDEGDDYVTRKSEFSTDYNTTINFIKKQSANGGGDFPEAVHSAMNVSINDLQWSTTATSRILFILLDAPPHYEAQIVDQVHSLVEKASLMGIKLIPITASGINKETEFLMRYLSIATNGTYVFITNHSGIGGDHLEPTIGEYEVEYLNELMVRIINKYLE